MCVVAALAIFTSQADAERVTVRTPIQVQLEVPGCFVNGPLTLKGSAILDCEFRLPRFSLLVDAQVRPDASASSPPNHGYRVEGTTTARATAPGFLNGQTTVTFPGSFRIDAGVVHLEIKYTAHLTFQLTPGGRIVLQSVSYDNFEVVC